MARPTRLQKVLDRLEAAQGELVGGPPRSPWAAILYENVVAAPDEARREQAFAALQKATGFEPARIAAASDAALTAICGKGAHAAARLAALRACAEAFTTVGDPEHLVAAEHDDAIAHLCRFPGVDAAVAERLLLFSGQSLVVAFDTHGLRTAARIGYGDETGDDALLRRTAEIAAGDELLDDLEVRIDAVLRLRQLGLTHCRTKPHCDACAVKNHCETSRLFGKNR